MASPPFCIKAYLSPWSLSLIGRIQKGGQRAIPFAPGRRRHSHAQGNEACALLPPPNFDLSGVHGALLQSHSLIFGAVGAIRSTIAGMHAPASEASPSGHDSVGRGDVRLVRLQHFGKIGVQPVIPHAGEDFTQFSQPSPAHD
jgi:hypothetical protein